MSAITAAECTPELCKVVPAFKQKGGMELDWDRGVPHREGAWTFTMSGTTNRKPFAGLNEDEQTRHKGELLYPNFMLSLSGRARSGVHVVARLTAHTTVLCDFLFHPSEMAQPDFNPNDAVEFWDITNRQDWVICESVQRGMASRVFRQGFLRPHGEHEPGYSEVHQGKAGVASLLRFLLLALAALASPCRSSCAPEPGLSTRRRLGSRITHPQRSGARARARPRVVAAPENPGNQWIAGQPGGGSAAGG